MAIALPTPSVAWNILACQRISYTSVAQVMRDTIFLIVKRLIAQGWVVRGSCNGVTGAMDGVDRWNTAADAGTRFNGAAGAQSWFVLRDADGADIMFSYNAATDDVYNFRVSCGGLAVAAGTPANEPTATDEFLLNKFYTTVPGTIVNSATSLDRIVSVWTRPDARGFRVGIARSGTWVSKWGKDRHTPATFAPGISIHPGHGFYVNGLQNTSSAIVNSNTVASSAAGTQFITRGKRTDGAGAALTFSRYIKIIGGNGAPALDLLAFSATQAELQGAASYALRKIGLFSITTSNQGDIGLFVDWFFGRTTGSSDGDSYGALQWVVMDSFFGLIWPWDGSTALVMS